MADLLSFDGGNKENAFKDGIRQLLANLPDYIEYGKAMAKLHRSKYEALIAEGFSEYQALELSKQVF